MPGRCSSWVSASRSCGTHSWKRRAAAAAGRPAMDDSQQKNPRPIGEQDLLAGIVVRGSLSARLIIGLIVIGLGVLFFLGTMGVIEIHTVWRYWPVALIGLRLAKALTPGGIEGRVFAGGVALSGTLLLLDNLEYINFSWKRIWPLALVFVGVAIVWRALAGNRFADGLTNVGATLSTVAILGGVNRKN